MKITLKRDYNMHKAGETIITSDAAGKQLISAGVAVRATSTELSTVVKNKKNYSA